MSSNTSEGEQTVIIVGAGPSGLATAACLSQLSIPYIILEREDCFAPLWKKYTYDRLNLHLSKQFCELPHLPFPPTYPTYVPKQHFLNYLDNYVSHFNISPVFQSSVESAVYDEITRKWSVTARKNNNGDEVEEYKGRFLVVATGETSDAFIPKVEGLETFTGVWLHSTRYKNGDKYREKRVLVVGSGNSGMEIALDLANYGAKTSLVVRSPVHIVSRGMAWVGLTLLKYRMPLHLVDSLLLVLAKIFYGDLTSYGITRPREGPFFCKLMYGKYPVIDVGTFNKIKSGQIQVLPAIESIRGNDVLFQNGKSHPFDVIIFATGFTRSTRHWLKGDCDLLDDDGVPKQGFADQWKGKKGLYCAGLARRGLYGAAMDAQNIATHINAQLL